LAAWGRRAIENQNDMSTHVTRPVLRYHGGKWKLATWTISHFPAHRVYVEPFGGAASVLLRKDRSYAEIYNDLDGEIVNLFRVLRDPSQSLELIRVVRLTPYARTEFELSYLTDGNPIEQARRTLLRYAAGFASGAQLCYQTGFRNNVTRPHSTPADNWRDFPDAIPGIVERLRGVVIENRPALELIAQMDGEGTLFYLDPPYVYGTRNSRNAGKTYRHEMDDDAHRDLAVLARSVRGMVVISGYPCELYDRELYSDWGRVERETRADGARERVEVLWLSPKTSDALQQRMPLFDQQEAE
jgi:DNA adenine methylase